LLVSREPEVSQPTPLTPKYGYIILHVGVRWVGWETCGSLETDPQARCTVSESPLPGKKERKREREREREKLKTCFYVRTYGT